MICVVVRDIAMLCGIILKLPASLCESAALSLPGEVVAGGSQRQTALPSHGFASPV
jgi:hypothetical protein